MVKECEVFQTSLLESSGKALDAVHGKAVLSLSDLTLLKVPLKPWNASVVKACEVFQTSVLESSRKALDAAHRK